MKTFVTLQFPEAFLCDLAKQMADAVFQSRLCRNLRAVGSPAGDHDFSAEAIENLWKPMLASMDRHTRRAFVRDVRFWFFLRREKHGMDNTTRAYVARVRALESSQAA